MSKLVLKGVFHEGKDAHLLAIPDSSIQFVMIQDKGYVVHFNLDTEPFTAPKSIPENVQAFNEWAGAPKEKEKNFYETD